MKNMPRNMVMSSEDSVHFLGFTLDQTHLYIRIDEWIKCCYFSIKNYSTYSSNYTRE